MRYIDQRVIDAVLGYPRSGFSFVEIHNHLIERGLVSPNDRTKTNRTLKKLIKEGLIKKTARGRYELSIDGGEFGLFDYLNSLRGEVPVDQVAFGESDIYLFGLPRADPPLSSFYEVLMRRIALIFGAFMEQGELKGRGISEALRREMLLELLPYSLSVIAGRVEDLDSLISEVLEVILRKDSIKPFAKTLETLLESVKSIKTRTEADEEPEPKVKMAMVVTPIDFLVDENDYRVKRLVVFLKENKEKDPLYMAYRLYLEGSELKEEVIEALIKRFIKDERVLEEYKNIKKANEWAELLIKMHRLDGTTKARTPKEKMEMYRLRAYSKTITSSGPYLIRYLSLALKSGGFFYEYEKSKADELLAKIFEGEPIENIRECLQRGRELFDRVVARMQEGDVDWKPGAEAGKE
ncbi:MAG: hypothetical protein QXO75_08135 [Nitrososphaerota archaeon]